MKFKQTNQIFSPLSNQSTLNKAHVIKITKACKVVFMKARDSLVVRYRENVSIGKKQVSENLFFKASS